MLRLHFGLDDLARTTFEMPSTADEVAGGAQSLQRRDSEIRSQFRTARVRLPASARPLLDVVPADGDLPGFLIPEVSGTWDDLLEVVLATPTSRIRADLAASRPTTPRAASSGELAAGRPAAIEQLGAAMATFNRHVLEPMLPHLRQVVTLELGRVAWHAATQGMESALNSLHPGIRWRDGLLEVCFPGEADIHLDGRGLVISPSAAWTRPGFTFHWHERLGLIYPVRSARGARTEPVPDHQVRLGDVFGSTRARVLTALASAPASGHSTRTLAASLGVSQASASTHAAALRGAGLVNTGRAGRAVRHTLTDLGRQLMLAEPGTEPARDAPADAYRGWAAGQAPPESPVSPPGRAADPTG